MNMLLWEFVCIFRCYMSAHAFLTASAMYYEAKDSLKS